MNPLKAAVDPSAGLIEVRHLSARELRADLRQELSKPLGALRDERLQRRDRDRRARPIGEDLGCPLVGQADGFSYPSDDGGLEELREF